MQLSMLRWSLPLAATYESVHAMLMQSTNMTRSPSPTLPDTSGPPSKIEAAPVPWVAIVVGIVPVLLLCAVMCMWYRRHTHTAQLRSSTPSNGDQAQAAAKAPAPSPSLDGSHGTPRYERYHRAPSAEQPPRPTAPVTAPLRRPSSSSRTSMDLGAVQQPRRQSNPSTAPFTQQARRGSNDGYGNHPPGTYTDEWAKKPGSRKGSTGSMSFETHVSSAADYVEPNPPFLSQFAIHPATTPWQPTQASHRETTTNDSDMSDTFMYATGSSTTAEYGYETSVHAATAPRIGQGAAVPPRSRPNNSVDDRRLPQ